MDKMLIKKINLLIYLAKIDGKFHRSEEKLLLEVLKEKGLSETFLKNHQHESVDLSTVHELPDKVELFYWVLKMIKADNYLHPDELAYSKTLAIKLNFKPEAVDFFSENEIQDYKTFEMEMKRFNLK